MLESRALNPEDFTETAAQGCRLSKEGRAVFFREWYRSEDEWLPKPARHALAIVLTQLRPLTNPRALPEYDSTVQDDRELIEF